MRQQSSRRRRTLAALLASGMVVGAATLSGTAPANAAPSPAPAPVAEAATPKDAPADGLDSHDADLLAKAEGSGVRNVTLIISTDSGKADDVAGQVESLGGTVTQRYDKVGYVLASVPTAKVVKAAKLPGVSAVDLDEKIQLPDPELTRGGATGAAQGSTLSGPGASTPAANPYMPTDEIGSVAFKKKHPTWDGRGVTIGIMDSGVDLDHPALQRTTTGERKIVDWVTATDPVTEGDGSWRAMVTPVTGPAFTYLGQAWTAPAGTWKVNRFTEAITAADEAKGDVNRDGDTTDVWGVLYDPESHDIRVDANQNHDFTDDAVMRPYREKYDVGHFGTDNAATPVVESTPFVVEYREDVDASPVGLGTVDFVSIGIPEGLHGTHVAGITAANDMLGNRDFDGQAPGAKIVSSRACSWGGGCTAAALTTGMVDLVVNRHADVVNVSIGGLPAQNDGNNARAQLYDKLIKDYGVQFFISAGNSGPGVNTVGDPSVATDVVSVAASVSKDTWLANYGSVVKKENALFNFSSRGPREDGGFKPNLTAPGSAISTINTWLNEPGVAEAGYTLPIGYAMENGTSMASPQATGGAALLLSAAKATDRGVTPAQLRRALYTSAEKIKDVPVAAQGNGLMDVNGAWSLLSRKVEARTYTSSAPVCTAFSDGFATPGQGVGIHNRCPSGEGGLKAGQFKTYNLKLTRTSGAKSALLHRLSVVGDKGSFHVQPLVLLPLDKTVTVPVLVTPKPGLNSAIIEVDDPLTTVTDFEVLNTVVTGVEPTKPAYAIDAEDSVDRNSSTSYFLDVPQGATALQVDLSGIATGSQTRWIAINPWGVPVESTSSLACYSNFSDVEACKPQERAYENPMPGVWELEVESRRTSPMLHNPYELTAKVQGVTVDPATVELPSATAGTATPVTWSVKNNFGPLKLTAVGGALGSARSERPAIANGASQEYTVDVPAGAQRLDVAIGNVSDAAADLDLTVYLGDAQVKQSADGDSEESVSIPKPAAGTYRVVINGYAVPSGTTQYDYQDVFLSPALGAMTVPSTVLTLAAGATAPVTGSVTAASAPAAGRSLFGEMSLVTDEEAIVGRGTVRIGEVR